MLDRLYAPFVSSVKKVPVRLQEDFTLADGYAWSSELIFIPDSLYVSGSPEKVDSLNTHLSLRRPKSLQLPWMRNQV